MTTASAIMQLLTESARDLPCAILLAVVMLLLLRMFFQRDPPRIFKDGEK